MKLPNLDSAAREEAVEATRWYSEVNPELATQFKNELEQALQDVATTPRRYPILETISTDREIRRRRLRRFPYLVIYELQEDIPYVLAIAHAHRRPNYWGERDAE